MNFSLNWGRDYYSALFRRTQKNVKEKKREIKTQCSYWVVDDMRKFVFEPLFYDVDGAADLRTFFHLQKRRSPSPKKIQPQENLNNNNKNTNSDNKNTKSNNKNTDSDHKGECETKGNNKRLKISVSFPLLFGEEFVGVSPFPFEDNAFFWVIPPRPLSPLPLEEFFPLEALAESS